MRRAAVSIPSNIAEGSTRKSAKEFLQYLSISQGSMAELETQLIVARNLKYCADIDGIVRELDELSKMTTGLYKTIGSKQAKRKTTAKANEN